MCTCSAPARALQLGTPAHGARDVQPRRRLAAAGEDEALQFRQALVVTVAERFEPVDLGLGDAQPVVAGGVGHRQIGAEVEELVLDSGKRLAQLWVEICEREHEPEL